MIDEYPKLDATALAALVAKGDVSPSELVQSAIEAAEALNPQLNAIVCRMYDAARAQAAGSLPQGPFRGVPCVIKDLDGFVAGVPYTMGSRFLREFVPQEDAEVIVRLKACGGVIIGKTNCPELGTMGTTEPRLHGPARNPWHLAHTPGGSSGGTAAAVAARVVPFGHGGDGGGSIRIPSSACGLFGLKPTRGRVPLGPQLGECWGGYAQPGFLCRSVRDAAGLLDAIHGPEQGAPYCAPAVDRPYREELGVRPASLRIAFSTASLFGEHTHPDCAKATQDAARLCEDLGHSVEEARPDIDAASLVSAFLIQVSASTAVTIAEAERWTHRRATPEDFEPATWFLKQLGNTLRASELQWSRDVTQAAGRLLARFHRDYDAFMCPTLAYPPVEVGELAPKPAELLGLAAMRVVSVPRLMRKALAELAQTSLEKTPNTQLFNQTGQPAMSVPLCWNDNGLPIGIQIAARFGDEATLFRLAAQLEEAQPWAEKLPPVCAGVS